MSSMRMATPPAQLTFDQVGVFSTTSSPMEHLTTLSETLPHSRMLHSPMKFATKRFTGCS